MGRECASNFKLPSLHFSRCCEPANSMLLAVKVHYSFDRENQVHCLAKWAQILPIQTLPLDDTRTIGVVDLRTCLLAVSQSSPEMLNQQENDYSVYAYDYSEQDVPLVGQGMLSWAMDLRREPQQQLVTGRVTRNNLAALTNGSRDTLEVKLKFAAVMRMPQRSDAPSMEPMNGQHPTPIPADTASEWNSFVQSNPMLGHPSNASAVSSPALAPAQLTHYNTSMSDNNRPMSVRSDSHSQQPIRHGSIPPTSVLQPITMLPASRASSVAPIPPRPQCSTDNAPSPAAPPLVEPVAQTRPSRPASRSRSSKPTGRPRGRPRKRPLETGNTSAVEEATDGDEGPQKRRAKVTKTEYSAIAPFGAAPDSLRVAASTSGSLRTMRPVGAGGEGPAASHLQDVPRAPTPIPDGMLLQQQRRRVMDGQARTDSIISVDQPVFGRSPADSTAQSPDHGYLPEDSAGDLNSSPPVPRTTPYIPSSPAGSSPVLPAMPMPPLDSGFMSGGLEDMFDEEMLQRLSQGHIQDQMLPVGPPAARKPNPRKNGRSQQQQQQQAQESDNFPFQEVNPGPPELLPTKSIFNPAGKAKALNRQTPAPSQPMLKKPASRSLKRSNTAPNPAMSEQEPLSQDHHATYQPNGNGLLQEESLNYQSNGHVLSQDPVQPYQFQEQASFSNGMVNSTQPMGNDGEEGYTKFFPQEPDSTPEMSLPGTESQESEPVLPALTQPTSRPASRPNSRDQPAPSAPIPSISACDFRPESLLTLPRVAASEPPCPPSDYDPPRYSKNLVKKQSIKEKLESAIQKGESPPFCSNCGAIETPTWRKIWTQDHDGVPGFHEFSDKPGCVTMIEVLERDENEHPSRYRMVKKNLGPKDDKKIWAETLLCNPCGIWLGKFKVHRPPDRWDKDAARLNQPRRKREPKGKSKKARTKSDAQASLTSEAYFATDPLGPPDHDFPMENLENGIGAGQQSMALAEEHHLNLRSSPRQRFMGSTHSRGSGTADSPIAVEDELGSTRRLLFPSPRRDGVPKVLGELSLNAAQTATQAQEAKSAAAGKENSTYSERPGTPVPDDHENLEQELFGTPPRCPSTPPPKAPAGPFKTPTRPTPSHRPITRSISRSIRSSRSIPKSPGQLFAQHLQRTPSRTPRSAAGLLHPSSASKRRTPLRSGGNHHNNVHAHFALDPNTHNQLSMGMAMLQDHAVPAEFDSPFTATLQQLLSEANDFIGGSPSRHGLPAHLDFQQLTRELEVGEHHPAEGSAAAAEAEAEAAGMDFGNFLGTDLVMPSSPPLLRGRGNGMGGAGGEQFGGVLQQQESAWGQQLAGSSKGRR